MSDCNRSFGDWRTFEHAPDFDVESGGDDNAIEEEVEDVAELCDDDVEDNDTVATGVEKKFLFKGTCIFIFFVVGSGVACVFSKCSCGR